MKLWPSFGASALHVQACGRRRAKFVAERLIVARRDEKRWVELAFCIIHDFRRQEGQTLSRPNGHVRSRPLFSVSQGCVLASERRRPFSVPFSFSVSALILALSDD